MLEWNSFIHVLTCLGVFTGIHVYTYAMAHMWTFTGQVMTTVSPFLFWQSWESGVGGQVWEQVPLPAEQPQQPQGLESLTSLGMACFIESTTKPRMLTSPFYFIVRNNTVPEGKSSINNGV